MPFNDVPPLPGLASTLQMIIDRLDALEARTRDLGAGSTIATDQNGVVRFVLGALNGPPTTLWGVQSYDSNGKLVTQQDSTGFHVYNTSAQEEARLGQLNASPAIYGVAVAPSTGSAPGTLQQVGGSISVAPPDANGVAANTSWTHFGSPSSLTAMVGPSGTALVTTVGYIVVHTTGTTGGSIGVSVDGGTPNLWNAVGQTNTSVLASAQYPVTGLSTGTHTFQLAYQTGASVVDFDFVTMTVQPL